MTDHEHFWHLDGIDRPGPGRPATIRMSCECGQTRSLLTARTDAEIHAEFDAQGAQ